MYIIKAKGWQGNHGIRQMEQTKISADYYSSSLSLESTQLNTLTCCTQPPCFQEITRTEMTQSLTVFHNNNNASLGLYMEEYRKLQQTTLLLSSFGADYQRNLKGEEKLLLCLGHLQDSSPKKSIPTRIEAKKFKPKQNGNSMQSTNYTNDPKKTSKTVHQN
ncbi:hypothetical protein CAPTEDRAFT_205736 [Capitella teleta]|uniref:Uncharacterized protein n=1 Tax=Capitella teleta TaxID=283909 RepID=R7TX73_CAPTE|nr:hypothetical protein CAPTEDRAFT_205736 [Capitella teleta]|eukprot:ELT98533.1 hypothetical protein CAPTEDRAFT_205736 [Capitella teleta]